jgi:ABC-type polysaccharide/polyol phosphate export permease
MTYLLGGARDLFIRGEFQDPTGFMTVSLIAVVTYLIVWRVFYVSEEKVIEKMI